MNIAETLGVTSVHVRRQTNADNAAMLSELLSNGVFSRFEGKVGNENGVAGRAQVVTEGLGAVLTLRGRSFGLGEIDVDSAAVDLGFVHSLLGLDAIGAVDKLDIAISAVMSVLIQTMIVLMELPFGTARVTISNDANGRQLSKALEFASEPFFIDVVRETTNEEIPLCRFVTHWLGLGLLSGGGGLSFGLALLRSRNNSLIIIILLLFTLLIG